MKIHEYQAKDLLRAAGVPVLVGKVARSPEEAAAAYTALGTPICAVKAQIHAGGRGKGTVKGGTPPMPSGSPRGCSTIRS
jgi:succinyl-CoA synthetase beta subunit